MQLFSAVATMCSRKKKFFFAHKKLKNLPSKVAHNQPKPFLRQSSPAHCPQPRSSFPFYKKPNPNVSLLVSGSIHKRNQIVKMVFFMDSSWCLVFFTDTCRTLFFPHLAKKFWILFRSQGSMEG